MQTPTIQDPQTTQTTQTTQIPDPAPPFGPDDPRALFGTTVGLATGVLGRVRPEQLDGPTPCTEMDVRQLLAHLVSVLLGVAALGRGEDPYASPDTNVDELIDVEDWRRAWLEAAHEVQAAWTDDAVLDRVMTLPWMTAPGRVVLVMYVSEVTVHTWDLATATGQAPSWDDRVLETSLSAMQAGLPAEGRRAAIEAVLEQMPPELPATSFPFAEAVPVATDAPLLHRLVAWTGRQP